MSTILSKKNNFAFQRWVETYNENYLLPFITEKASGKYRIDMFKASGMFYLWYPSKEQYIEIETSLDMTIRSNVIKLIETFDSLITDEEI